MPPVLLLLVASGVTLGPVESAERQDAARAAMIRRVEREQARYRAWDRNGDRVLTAREWRGSAAAFRQLDTNRDGRLTDEEIWIQLPADREASEQDQRRLEMLTAFYRADRNNDGRLTRTEWWGDRPGSCTIAGTVRAVWGIRIM